MLMKSEYRILPKKQPLEKGKTLMYFDSNVNRDGMKEENVAKTVVLIKF